MLEVHCRCGHNFYTARNYPKILESHCVVCEPRTPRAYGRIEKRGAGFKKRTPWNYLPDSDEGFLWDAKWDRWCRLGLDCMIYWATKPYTHPDRGGYAAENGLGNAYENPLRDKSYGRIWRIVSQEATQEKAIKLDKEDADDLIKTLSHDNLFWRMTAQRLLVERSNTDVLPKLYAVIKDQKVDELGGNYAATHALWAADGLGALHKDDQAAEIMKDALTHKSPGVRKAATQILSKGHLTETTVTQSNILNDPDLNTRLAAVLPWGGSPSRS